MKTLAAPKFIWPPRATSGSMPLEKVSAYAKYGWRPQLKLNDNHLCLSKEGDNVVLYSRSEKKLTKFSLPDWMRTEIDEMCDKLGLDKEAWSYLDGGVLHFKHQYFRNTIAIWDILVRDNQYLIGTTYRERFEWLIEKAGDEPYYIEIDGKKWQIGIKITEHIFIPIFFDTVDEAWQIVEEVNEAAGWKGKGEPLLEGVVLKDEVGVLKQSYREKNNEDWMARCRVRTGRHRF